MVEFPYWTGGELKDAHNHRILWIHLFFKTYSDLCIFEFFDNMMDCSHLYFEGGVNKRIIPIVNYWG